MKLSEMPMFYGAKPSTFEKANVLRKKMTPAEKILWTYLKNNQLNNLKFRRQHPISIFIADFYCHALKLVIELDGKIHNKAERKEWDISRTAEMENFGIKILRFKNEDVLNNIQKVIKEIAEICVKNSTTSPPAP